MGSLALSRPVIRAAFCAFLLLLPLGAAWNLVVAPSHPSLAIKIGPKLGGVTYDTPVILSWASLRDGSFQKAASSRIADAMPVRPLLIRINNEIRFELFGEVTAPDVVRGANGHLIERLYLDDYCGRTEGMGATFAANILPKLKDIQSYYEKRGSVFVYVVSPSKAAHLPEYFVDRIPCPSTPAARAQLLPDYVGALKQAGIHVVDTASLIHSLKGSYPFDLFPQGGVHWNDVGGARAVSVIVDAINQQAGREIIPPFKFTYALSGVAGGADRELVDLLNVFFPPLGYQTPKVSFQPEVPCAQSPARDLNVAMVGSSFGHLPARIMVEANCLERLQFYYYFTLGRFGGTPYRELQRNLSAADLGALRDAKIVILEENEQFAGRKGFVDYVDPLRKLLNGP
jgi:alginate O-acetyltransferase complex protein AlgJ